MGANESKGRQESLFHFNKLLVIGSASKFKQNGKTAQ